MQRSNSWSASMSTPAASSSNDSLGTDSSPHRSYLSRSNRNAAPCVTAPAQGALRGEVGAGHIVFESESFGSSMSSAPQAPSAHVLMTASAPITASAQATSGSSPADASYAPHNAANAERHANRSCTPCLRFVLKSGCKDGNTCKYCHLPHNGEKLRQRPGKGSRAKCQQLIQTIIETYTDREERLDHLQELVQEKHPFTRSLLLHKIKDYEEIPVRHQVGQIDRSRLSHELKPGGHGAIPTYETPLSSNEQALLHKMAKHHAEKAKLAEAFKAMVHEENTRQGVAHNAQRGQVVEKRVLAPGTVIAAACVGGSENSPPIPLERGPVGETTQSERRTKTSL